MRLKRLLPWKRGVAIHRVGAGDTGPRESRKTKTPSERDEGRVEDYQRPHTGWGAKKAAGTLSCLLLRPTRRISASYMR